MCLWPSHYVGWLSSKHILYLGAKDYISQEGRSLQLTCVHPMVMVPWLAVPLSYVPQIEMVLLPKNRKEKLDRQTGQLLLYSPRQLILKLQWPDQKFVLWFLLFQSPPSFRIPVSSYSLGNLFCIHFVNGVPDLHRRPYPGQFKPRCVQRFLCCLFSEKYSRKSILFLLEVAKNITFEV